MSETRHPATDAPSQVQENEFTVAGADGYRMACSHFAVPGGQPKGVLACIHGIQSHAGWYTQSCRWFAQAGYETYFLDRRGSGRNQIDRGHCSGYRQLVEDLQEYVRAVRQQHVGLPVYLLAISWGGKLAAAALQNDDRLVDGVVFVCPGWFAKVSPPLREKLAIGWSFLVWPRRMLNVPLGDPALFTANAPWQEFLRKDPLSLRQATARTLMSSRILDRVLAKAPRRIRTPALLFLGGQDRIIDNDRSRHFFESFAAAEKQVIEYPQAHHTLEFEPDPVPYFQDTIRWLDQRTAAKRAHSSALEASSQRPAPRP